MRKILIGIALFVSLVFPFKGFAEDHVITASKEGGILNITFYKVDVREDYEHITFNASLVASDAIVFEDVKNFLEEIILVLQSELETRADELVLIINGDTEVVIQNE